MSTSVRSLILFSVALMGWIWGVAGMLLAVPLITAARVIIDSFPATQFLVRLCNDVEHSSTIPPDRDEHTAY